MSERYKPKQLVREANTPEHRAKVQLGINHSRTLVEEHQRARRMEKLQNNTRIVNCRHEVFWLDCTICSKTTKR